MSIKQRYLNTKEAAHYTGWKVDFLNTARITGHLKGRTPGPPFIKIGRRIFYCIDDLDIWMQSHRRDGTTAYQPKVFRRTLPKRAKFHRVGTIHGRLVQSATFKANGWRRIGAIHVPLVQSATLR